jgi:oligo-1,6-glucosidase
MLIEEANKRDIKIIMDLVINHTSNNHVWFKEALKDKNSKYRDYYYFRAGNGKKPPNNWNSSFSGSCWEKVKGEENMYYLHLYTVEQADLNYHNPEVIEEVERILKFYLDKGVAGFRCDVINQIYKTTLANGKFRLFNCGKEHYESQEENFQILRRFQDNVISKYPGAFLVGETSGVTPQIGNKFLNRGCLQAFFEFEHAFCDMNSFVPIFKKKFKPKNLINPILKWQEQVPWIGAYLENHDQRRSVTRFGDEGKYWKESAKALCLFLLSLKGTPFIYQGQEIGTIDYKDLTYEETDDCMAKSAVQTAGSILKLKPSTAFKLVNKTINRDHARNPMQWENSFNAGFNDGCTTWLKVNKTYQQGINVDEQLQDPSSILRFYKKMIAFRNKSKTLKEGSFMRAKANPNVAKFIRQTWEETLLIVVNLSNKTIYEEQPNYKVLIANDYDINEKYLKPYQAIIYKIK